jgi:hypothetical protein
MMANENLGAAKKAKNDEFYTQYADIQKEMCENEDLYQVKTKRYATAECKAAYEAKFGKPEVYDLNASGVLNVDGRLEKVYQRILIRHRSI